MSIVYVGIKTKEAVGHQEVLRVENGKRTPLDPKPSQKLFNHSPDGFQWGYAGSGPAQLALAILLDVTGAPDLSVRLHQGFKFDKIAAAPNLFLITRQEVLDWVSKY